MRRVIIPATIAVALSFVCGAIAWAGGVQGSDIFSAVGTPRNFASAPGVHEYLFTAQRGPTSLDRIALHRVARSTGAATGRRPVVLYLPGTWMNGTVAPDDPRYSLALFFASHDVDFWALDYRTHFVPAEFARSDLAELKDWTNALFASDIDAAVRFIMATTGHRRIVVAGFSRGVSFAYLSAAEHPQNVAGLLIFDGYIGHGEARSPPRFYAQDVAGRHLTWEKRAALLQLVIDNPRGPAPVAKYKDAADNLDHVVYDSAGFGGKGGLANPIGGFSDPAVLARVLITYDRYWPVVQDYEDPFPGPVMAALHRSKIPVLAFSSTNITADWPDRVTKSASSTGRAEVCVTRLRGWGHLDVICGTFAARKVFKPALAWLRRLRE